MANTVHGRFLDTNTGKDGYTTTAPRGSFRRSVADRFPHRPYSAAAICNGGGEVRVSSSPKESQLIEAQIFSKVARTGLGPVERRLEIRRGLPKLPAIVSIGVERVLSLSIALGIVHSSIDTAMQTGPKGCCRLFNRDRLRQR